MTIETNQVLMTNSQECLPLTDDETIDLFNSEKMNSEQTSKISTVENTYNAEIAEFSPKKRKISNIHNDFISQKKQRSLITTAPLEHQLPIGNQTKNYCLPEIQIPSTPSYSSSEQKLYPSYSNSSASKVKEVVRPFLNVDQINQYHSYIKDIDKKLVNDINSTSIARLLAIQGTYYQKLGEYEHSITLLERSVQLNPTSAFGYTRMGESYRLFQQYDKSINAFETTMEFAEESAFLYSRYGCALYDSGKKLDEAKKLITRSYSMNPRDLVTVRYAQKMGILNDLMASRRIQIKETPILDPDTLFRSGFSAYKRGYPIKALDFLDKAINRDQNHVQSLSTRGEIYLSKGDYSNAKKDFEKVILLSPYHSVSLLGLANSCLMEGEQSRGIELLDRVIELSPVIIIARIMRGEEYRKLQRHQEAYEDFNTVIRLIENYHQRIIKNHVKPLIRDKRYHSNDQDTNQWAKEHEKNLAYAYGRRGMLTYRLNPEKIDQVQENFEKAHDIDPDETFVWSARGTIEYEKGNFLSATYYFKECLRRTPKHTHSMNNLGEIARLEKNYNNAKNYFKKSIEANPKNAFAYERLGDIYRETRDTEKALMCLNKALELNPSSHFALSCRGDLFRSLSRLPEAYQDLNNALGIQKDAFTFSNLGEVYRMSGVKNYSAALQAYNQAIRIDKTFSFAYFCKAKLYATYEKYDQALQNLNISINLDNQSNKPANHLAILLRANIYLSQENYTAAKEDLIRAETKAGCLPIIQRYWTMYWYRTGNLHKALESITKAITIDPSQAVYYSERAKIQLFLRNYQAAAKDVDSALGLDMTQPTALSVKGVLLSLDRNYDGAIETLQSSISKEPRNGFSHSALGEVYRITNEFDKAKKELNLAIRYSSKSPMPYFLRGILHFETGEYANAMDDFGQYELNIEHYFAPLAKSKETLDTLVACMRLIIFLQTNKLFYSKTSSEKYQSMLIKLNANIPEVDLAIFRNIPDGMITESSRKEIQKYIAALMQLIRKDENFYALSSLSILYLLLGDETNMKGTLNDAFNTLKLMPSSPKALSDFQSEPLGIV